MQINMSGIHLRTRTDGSFRFSYDPIDRVISVKNISGSANKFNLTVLNAPLRVVAEITSLCNLRCSYCSQGDVKKGKAAIRRLDTEDIKQIVDQADDAKVLEFTFRGAEATLHPDFAAIWDYAAQKDFISINLITNGMRLDKNIANMMLANPRSKIIVSLDGPEEINSTFRNPQQYKKVMTWLPQTLSRSGDQIVVLSTLYKENLPYMHGFAAALAETGLKHFHVTLLKRLGETKNGIVNFVTPDEMSDLENKLDDVAKSNPGFLPSVNCPLTKREINLSTGVPMPLFTEYFCGTGMKIMVDGSIGISQIIYFNNEFRQRMEACTSTSLNGLGIVGSGRSLQEIWSRSLELRIAQAHLAKQQYPFFLGFSDETL